MRIGIAGVDPGSLRERAQRLGQVVGRIPVMQPLQIELIDLDLRRVLTAHGRLRLAPPHQLRLQRLDDACRDRVLDREDVRQIAVEAVGPDRLAVLDVHDLGSHPELAAGGTDAALEQVPDAHVFAICPRSTIVARAWKVEVRGATRSPSTRASAVRISSAMPSQKYA